MNVIKYVDYDESIPLNLVFSSSFDQNFTLFVCALFLS